MATPETYRFMLSGGGTGGHIFPALAIANALREAHPGCEIEFVGALGRMEMTRVPKEGYTVHGLPISGLNRRNMAANLKFPVRLIRSIAQCRRLLRQFRPHVVIGTGGFASGPLLYVAQRMGIPTLIQEQNSYAGITNKWLGSKAKAICVAYEGMEVFFPAERIHLTGNPVRPAIVNRTEDRQAACLVFGLPADGTNLLVLGGSLGARRINEAVEVLIPWARERKVNILWQCGTLYHRDLEMRYGNEAHVHLHAFINNMEAAYSAGDIIMSRAGAGTISELALIGKPVVLIPSPNVAEDHQTKNAMAMVARNAAVLIPESEIDKLLEPELESLRTNEGRRKSLGNNIHQMAIPDATLRIVNLINPWLP